ncbi:hypothetical protein H2198_003671 [Neophaeococcomyces mojaviensis]|uniref:Uncharacterized protein n=1 Tax=Neophaeococcomyces mojaviensis TaxID=3383035 RepID=A0ACC3ABC5_9EURO|nr:hypothetical protein H2198_003671 [Knufia sp. JES_112]
MNTEEVSLKVGAAVVNKVLADQNTSPQYTNEELNQQYFALTARQTIRKFQEEYSFTLISEQIEACTIYEEDLLIELLHKTPILCNGVHAIPKKLTEEKSWIAQYFDEDQVFSTKSSMPTPKSKPDPVICQWEMKKNGCHNA